MKSIIALSIVAALAIGFVAGSILKVEAPTLGERITNLMTLDGLNVGYNNQFSVDADGDLSTSATVTVTGRTAVQEFTQGGGVLTLTDANGGTYTLTEAELLSSNYLKFAAGGAGQAVIALTLPATSTMTALIPNAGDCREWIYDASALVAATTTTITAGTGHDLIAYTTNDDVIDGAEFAEIRMCRQADGDVTTFTSEMLHAD